MACRGRSTVATCVKPVAILGQIFVGISSRNCHYGIEVIGKFLYKTFVYFHVVFSPTINKGVLHSIQILSLPLSLSL